MSWRNDAADRCQRCGSTLAEAKKYQWNEINRPRFCTCATPWDTPEGPFKDGSHYSYCVAGDVAEAVEAYHAVIRRLLRGWTYFNRHWTRYRIESGDGGVPDEPMTDAEVEAVSAVLADWEDEP